MWVSSCHSSPGECFIKEKFCAMAMARPARAAAAVCLSVASLLLRRSAALEVQLDHRGLDPFLDSWRYNFNLEGQSEAVKSYFDPCQDDIPAMPARAAWPWRRQDCDGQRFHTYTRERVDLN